LHAHEEDNVLTGSCASPGVKVSRLAATGQLPPVAAQWSSRCDLRSMGITTLIAKWLSAATVVLIASCATANAQAPPPDDPPVKLSSSGICHERGTSSYGATLHYQAFDTLADCIKAGGRARKSKHSGKETVPDAVQTDPAAARSPAGDAATPLEPAGSDWGALWNRIATRPAPYIGIAAAVVALLWIGRVLLQRRARRVYAEQERDAARRWRGHRLERYDAADERRLLAICRGDRDRTERLVQAEMRRDSTLTREDAIVAALERARREHL
jgi:hypothetical protein